MGLTSNNRTQLMALDVSLKQMNPGQKSFHYGVFLINSTNMS